MGSILLLKDVFRVLEIFQMEFFPNFLEFSDLIFFFREISGFGIFFGWIFGWIFFQVNFPRISGNCRALWFFSIEVLALEFFFFFFFWMNFGLWNFFSWELLRIFLEFLSFRIFGRIFSSGIFFGRIFWNFFGRIFGFRIFCWSNLDSGIFSRSNFRLWNFFLSNFRI